MTKLLLELTHLDEPCFKVVSPGKRESDRPSVQIIRRSKIEHVRTKDVHGIFHQAMHGDDIFLQLHYMLIGDV